MFEVTNEVEVETWASDMSNSSTVQPAEMAENNTNTDMDDSEGLTSQTQPAEDNVNMDQETENEEKNPSTSDDQKVLCYICEETEAVVAFKPCGHTVVCIGSSTFCFSCCFLFCVNHSNSNRASFPSLKSFKRRL